MIVGLEYIFVNVEGVVNILCQFVLLYSITDLQDFNKFSQNSLIPTTSKPFSFFICSLYFFKRPLIMKSFTIFSNTEKNAKKKKLPKIYANLHMTVAV